MTTRRGGPPQGAYEREAARVRNQRALELIRQGLPAAVVAERLGMTPANVKQVASRAGLRLAPEREWL